MGVNVDGSGLTQVTRDSVSLSPTVSPDGQTVYAAVFRSGNRTTTINEGAGFPAGNIALELVSKSQPDGYTLLVGNVSTNSINPILFAGKTKANAVKDLTGGVADMRVVDGWYACSDCVADGDVNADGIGEVVARLGHNYVDGIGCDIRDEAAVATRS